MRTPLWPQVLSATATLLLLGFRMPDDVRSEKVVELARIDTLVRSAPASGISQIGRAMGLHLQAMPSRWLKDTQGANSVAEAEYTLLWPAMHDGKWLKFILFSYRRIYDSPNEYIEIALSYRPCLTLNDLMRRLGARPQYDVSSVGDLAMTTFSGLELREPVLNRTIFLDGFETRDANGGRIPGLFNIDSKACITRFNIDGDPPVLFADHPT